MRTGVIAGLVAILSGCGGTGIQAPATVTQSAGVRPDGSWMAPEAKGEDLLYVSEVKRVAVYSYPGQKKVGELTGFTHSGGLCSDREGNVWVTDYRASKVTEFAHGVTKPIARLNDEDEPAGCAVDPNSGKLAVVNGVPSSVWIYANPASSPTSYSIPPGSESQYCTYDGSGDLFIDGWGGNKKSISIPVFFELPSGGSQFHRAIEASQGHGLGIITPDDGPLARLAEEEAKNKS